MAITRNGGSSSCVAVPLVTVCSCMASSSADCVLGVARLISSASTRCAKIGPGWKRSAFVPPSRIDDHAADDVGGHQVGRELDARILQVQHARKRPQQRGLAQARNAFEQHVAARQQADQHAIDDVLLADDDLSDFLADPVQLSRGELEGGIWLHRTILPQNDCLGRPGCISAYRRKLFRSDFFHSGFSRRDVVQFACLHPLFQTVHQAEKMLEGLHDEQQRLIVVDLESLIDCPFELHRIALDFGDSIACWISP